MPPAQPPAPTPPLLSFPNRHHFPCNAPRSPAFWNRSLYQEGLASAGPFCLGLRRPQGLVAGSFSSRCLAGPASRLSAFAQSRTPLEYESPLLQHTASRGSLWDTHSRLGHQHGRLCYTNGRECNETAASVTQAAVSKCSLSSNLKCCRVCKQALCYLESITCKLVPLKRTETCVSPRHGPDRPQAAPPPTANLQPLYDSFIVKKECLRKQEPRCKTPRR
jgi:hypothetical protein